MSSPLERSIDQSLGQLQEAAGQFDDLFGQTRPGRDFEDLKWVAAPVSQNPIDRRTGQPTGQPWTMAEVWAALKPVVVRRARQLAGGAFSKSGEFDRGVFEDLIQNAALTIVQAIQNGKDEGRLGNSFVSWIDDHIRTAMQMGKSAANYFRPARGILGILDAVRDPASAAAALQAAQDRLAKAGPYGERLLQLATALNGAYQTNDLQQAKTLKVEMKKMHDEIREAEEGDRTQGAFTGLHDTISVKGRRANRDQFRAEHGRMQGMSVPGDEGGEIENPGAPHEVSHVGGLASREAARRIMDIARHGYKGPEGEIHPLEARDFRILIRLYGLSDYPGVNTFKDPEFNKETYDQVFEALSSGQSVAVQPQTLDELERLAQWINASPETQDAMHTAFSEYSSAKEGGQDPGEPVTVKVRSADPDVQEEVAFMAAMSPWARSGHPALGPKAIKQDMGWDFSDVRMNTLINQITKGVKDRPSKKGKAGWTSELGRLLGPRIAGDTAQPAVAEARERAVGVLLEFNSLINQVHRLLGLNEQEIRAVQPFHRHTLRTATRLLSESMTTGDMADGAMANPWPGHPAQGPERNGPPEARMAGTCQHAYDESGMCYHCGEADPANPPQEPAGVTGEPSMTPAARPQTPSVHLRHRAAPAPQTPKAPGTRPKPDDLNPEEEQFDRTGRY
jgi:hypothetical protein